MVGKVMRPTNKRQAQPRTKIERSTFAFCLPKTAGSFRPYSVEKVAAGCAGLALRIEGE